MGITGNVIFKICTVIFSLVKPSILTSRKGVQYAEALRFRGFYFLFLLWERYRVYVCFCSSGFVSRGSSRSTLRKQIKGSPPSLSPKVFRLTTLLCRAGIDTLYYFLDEVCDREERSLVTDSGGY